MSRMRVKPRRWRWPELLNNPKYRGRWVALDDVRYQAGSSQPAEGMLVDYDEDLASLCERIQSAEHTSCSIVYCDDGGSGIRRAGSQR